MILHLLLFSVILIISSQSSTSAQANCNRVCRGGAGGRRNKVSYPFGFSDGCEIRLDCSEGEIRFRGYTVQNLTRDHISINLPANCNRSFEEINRFDHSNFALTSRNELLLENCSARLNDCIVPTNLVKTTFSIQQCDSAVNRSMNCYSEENPREEFIDLTELKSAGCEVLLSSVTIDLNENISQGLPVSLEFQSLELGWWVQGDCGCDKNAVCRNVSRLNQTVGYRCHCNEGYDGDGFIAGDGCSRDESDGQEYWEWEWGFIISIVLGFIIGFWVVVAPLVASKEWTSSYFDFLHKLWFNICIAIASRH